MKIEEIDLKKNSNVLEALNKILDCTTAIGETIRIIKRDKTITYFFTKNLELRLKAVMARVKDLQGQFEVDNGNSQSNS